MKDAIATFSGKYGDILWSLPTVRELAKRHGSPIDFACMPEYRSLLPLLKLQSYIKDAFVIEDWACIGSPHGDQPWEAPHVDEEYANVWHLTYKYHPYNEALAYNIAVNQGIRLPEPAAPFIETGPEGQWEPKAPKMLVSYNFNAMYAPEKARFLEAIREAIRAAVPDDVVFVELEKFPWELGAWYLTKSLCFIGCRSSNYVLAHGVGTPVICFEPHPMRGGIFKSPWGTELDTQDASVAIAWLKNRIAERQVMIDAASQTIAR